MYDLLSLLHLGTLCIMKFLFQGNMGTERVGSRVVGCVLAASLFVFFFLFLPVPPALLVSHIRTGLVRFPFVILLLLHYCYTASHQYAPGEGEGE